MAARAAAAAAAWLGLLRPAPAAQTARDVTLVPRCGLAARQRVSAAPGGLPAGSAAAPSAGSSPALAGASAAGLALVAAAAAGRARARRGRAGGTACARAAAAPRRQAALAPALGLLARGQPAQAGEAKEIRSLGDEKFGIDLPEGFAWSEKAILLRTHALEQRVTANQPYGKWTVGITIDDVMANGLAEVGTPEQIAERIAGIERKKDGNFSTEVLSASRGEVGGYPADVIEYRADTSRGFYHYLVRVALINGKLYNVTSQSLEDQWQELATPARKALDSMRLKV